MNDEKNSPADKIVGSTDGLGAITGWVIVHPDGSYELDYFYLPERGKFLDAKAGRITAKEFAQRYRPSCKLVRAVLTPNKVI